MALTTINSGGVKDDSIVNADIKSDAAIAGAKIAPDFGSQNIVTTGTINIGGTGSYVGSNVVRFSPSGAAYIDHDTTGQDINFRMSNSSALDTTALVIKSSGFIGAGTSSPNHMLQLHRSDSNNSYTQYTNSTTGSASGDGVWLGMGGDEICYLWQNENNHMVFGTNNAERLRITSDGAVGIGTNSPANLLSLESSAPVFSIRDTASYSAYTNGGKIYFQGLDSDGAVKSFAGIKGVSQSSNNGQLRLQTRTGGTLYDRLTINAAGDVSIEDGNLVVANGHGIDFSAQTGTSATGAATGSAPSEVLDHYEEGTWTATVVTGTCSDNECHYTKIGNKCTVWGRVHSFSDTSTNDVLKITGLPFTVGTSNTGGNSFQKHISTEANCTYVSTNNWITFYGHNTADQWSYVTHLSCSSGAYIYFHATYKTT